ncbi:THAP domain-containing protein 1-like [Pecten maximus]|uniref:THAP domain-containing protein 1-like n=1 Tax=Pecten maximus TaxID=6579 RepID=UPI001458A5B5|nr:THAP domain-containing protein 1-like [Pecten maximus]
MVHCAAPNCTNSSNVGKKVSMFLFPKDKKLRTEWTEQLKRNGFYPSIHARLCQYHFEPECFQRDPRLMASIGFQPKSLRLKPGAIPTIFNSCTPQNRKRTYSEEHGVPKKQRLEPQVEGSQVLSEVIDLHNYEDITLNQGQIIYIPVLSDMNEETATTTPTTVYRSDQCHIATQTEPFRLDKCVGPDAPMQT